MIRLILTRTRTLLRIVATIFCYYITVTALRGVVPGRFPYPMPDFLVVLVMSMLLSIFGALLSIDLRKMSFQRIELILILILLSLVVLIYRNVQPGAEEFIRLIAIAVFHVGLRLYLRTKRFYFTVRRKFSSRSMGYVGIVSFGLMIGFVLSLLLGYQLITTPLQCNSIYTSIENLVNTPLKPITGFAQNVRFWGDRPLSDMIEMTDFEALIPEVDTTILSGGTIDASSVGGELLIVDDSIQQNTGSFPLEEEIVIPHESGESLQESVSKLIVLDENTNSISLASGVKLGTRVDEVKVKLVDQTLDDTSLIRQSICDVIVQLVEKNIQQGIGAISIFIVLFFVFSPLVSFLFRIVVFVIRILLVIFQVCRIYRRKKRLRRVEEIE